MSNKLNLPKSWANTLQAETVKVLKAQPALALIAEAIIGRTEDDLRMALADTLSAHGLGIYVWPYVTRSLHTNVRSMDLPQLLELQIDVRELVTINRTGCTAHDVAEYILQLLHGVTLTCDDGRSAAIVAQAKPLQTSHEDEEPLTETVTFASLFFDVRPQCAAAQPTPPAP